jgi:transcription elongation factor GreA
MAELKQTLLTPEGKRELEAMLPTLVAQKREVKERLQGAKTYGDAADGGEIGEAKDELLRLDRRINEIEYTLSHAKVVDATAGDGTVRIGSRATVVDDAGETETWTIVEPAEASTRNRKISDHSPMGAAMFGKRAGDEIRVRAPGGDLVYRILTVE